MVTNERNRIAVVTMYFEPESTGSAPYITQTATRLADEAHEVCVFTTWPHYPAWRTSFDAWEGQSDERPNLWVRRFRTFVPARPKPSSRLAYELIFAIRALLQLLREPAFDLYVGCSPNLFSAVVARCVGLLKRRPVLVLVQDVVSAASQQTGQSNAGFLSRALRVLEGWCLRGAARVVIPTEGFLAAMEGMKVDAARTRVVRNWSHLMTVPMTGVRASVGRIIHTGNMGQKQALDALVPSVAEALRADERLEFWFVGDGNRRAELESAVSDMPRVRVLPPVNAADYPRLLREASVLLVHERPGVVDMSLPSKLTSYFAAGRPVLAVVDPAGVTANEVRFSGAGVVVPQGDPPKFVAALRRLLDDPDFAAKLSAAGPVHCERHLSSAAGLTAISNLVGEVICESEQVRLSK